MSATSHIIHGHKDALLAIFVQASYYAAGYCIQTSSPASYKVPPYYFDDMQVGFTYITMAGGVMLSMYASSAFIDWNYKSMAAKIGFAVDKVKGDDLSNFPIEETRFRWAGILNTLCLATMVGYGWSMEKQAHVSVPLILQFLFAFFSNCLIQTSSVLLVDIFPKTPSIATTAGSISRCVLTAIAIAVQQPILKPMGRGWYFTMLGVLSGLGSLGAVTALRCWGMAWRKSRNSGETDGLSTPQNRLEDVETCGNTVTETGRETLHS